jgi:tetratricopeptide (TPR) repeat protein
MDMLNLKEQAFYAVEASDFLALEQIGNVLIDNSPDIAFGYKCLSIAYYGQGRIESALNAMTRLAKIDSDDYENLLNMGKLLYNAANYKLAADTLQEALKLSPQNVSILNELAKSLTKIGQFNLAIEYFALSIKHAPSNPEAFVLISDVLMLGGHVTKAMDILKPALFRFSNIAEVWHRMGIATQRSKMIPEAIEYYKKAIELQLQKPLNKSEQCKNNGFDYVVNEKILLETLALLCKNNIRAFAVSGSLLGLVREGHLLQKDKDIDIGVFVHQMPEAINILLANGYTEYFGSYGMDLPRVFRYQNSGLLLDLYGYRTDGDKVVSGFFLSDVPEYWNRIVEYTPFELHKIQTLYGNIWQISDTDTYLTELYGDWRNTDPYFESTVCAKNLRTFSFLTQCYALNKIFIYLQEGKIDNIKKLADTCYQQLPNDDIYAKILRFINSDGTI